MRERNEPAEQQTVRTTIVGGRPPGSGMPLGPVPRGIEVLVKKASVDPEFKRLLLDVLAEAAKEIELALDPSEALMLRAVPAAQLEAIIAQTTLPHQHRRTFLGKAAAAMLAAVGVSEVEAGIKGGFGGAGAGGVRIDMPVAKTEPALQGRVTAVLTQHAKDAPGQIVGETAILSLIPDAQDRDATLGGALEREFDLTIPTATWTDLRTVDQLSRYLETALGVRRHVVDAIARQGARAAGQITRATTLEADLQLTALKRSQLRRKLAGDLRAYLPWEGFKRLGTVGDVVDYVARAVRRREAGEQKRELPPGNPRNRLDFPTGGSFGIRPGGASIGGIIQGRPEKNFMGASGGIRPKDPPPLMQRKDPYQQADELRREAEEYRKRMLRQQKPKQ